MRTLQLIAATAFITTAIAMPCARAQSTPAPILIELFTSEGCSSCPPADAWLEKMDASQPVPGAQLIVLSEHVDYWDRDGWKDPYSSSLFTDRQQGYVRAFGLSSPYTPQLIVDGKAELQLDQPNQVRKTLFASVKDAPVRVTLGPTTASDAHPGEVQTHIEVDGTSATHSADIYAAVALSHAKSQVLRGENAGHNLAHVAVVEELVKVGHMEKGKLFSRDIQTELPAHLDPANLRLIFFVQQPDQGPVVGAAMQSPLPAIH